MDINLKLDENFIKALDKMKRTYGDKFDKLNGFDNSNLNFTDFIDNFVDSNNKEDKSIDANANRSSLNINVLKSDMTKPHLKLLAYNKIFYEMNKIYGRETAEQWLEDEWNGAFYLHNASSSTYTSYCVFPKEMCYYVYQGKILHSNFEDIYKILQEPEIYLEDIDTYAKFPKGLQVQDKNGWTNVKRICWHENKDKDMHFVKTKNGQSIITTEDHTFFNKNGDEIIAKKLNKTEELDLVFNKELFTNSITHWGGRDLDYDLGWFVGFIAAEGTIPKKSRAISVSQSTKSKSDIKHFLDICDKKGIEYKVYDYQEGVININLLAGGQQNQNTEKFNWRQFIASVIKGNYSYEKHLTPEYIHFDNDFLIGFISGLFDGDGTVINNSMFSLRLSSRTMINQVFDILLVNGVSVSNRKPYIQVYERDVVIKQTRPMYGLQVNMNAYPEFFMSFANRKVGDKWINKEYNVKMANKTFSQKWEDSQVVLNDRTFFQDIIFDLTTDTGSFICNNIRIHNCFAYDLDQVVEKGLFFIDKFKTKPAKHLTTFNDHILEFISWTSNQTSGAAGIPSYLIYSFYFWKKDIENNFYLRTPEYYRDQCFQKFIYDLNQPYLRIIESAFTNISIMDRCYLEEVFGGREYPDGTFVIDYIDEIIEYQKSFMNVVSEIRKEMMATFPVLTYSLLYQNGKFVDEEFAKWCSDHNTTWMDSNFFCGDNVTSLSSCCRLVNDFSKLEGFVNSIGGSSVSIGSVQVNTINLRRIALEANYYENPKKAFIEILTDRVHLTIKVLDVIRNIISRNVDKGLLPIYSYKIIEIKNQFNTIGITAMYEAIRDLKMISKDEFGHTAYTQEGLDFASKILDTINEIKDSYTLGYSLNVEAVPAERANNILCDKDNLLFGDNGDFLYSNQWIPLMSDCSLDEKIKLGSILDIKCGGGQIQHINVDGQFANKEQAWKLLNKIAKAGVIYFAFNNKICVCEDNHGFTEDKCPTCGKDKVSEYSRIVGYLVDKNAYSKKRKREYDSRRWFTIE